MTCPLCEIAQGKNISTKIYYPPEERIGEMDWTFLDCKNHNVPMGVFYKHVTTLSITELSRFINIIENLWPRTKWTYDVRFHEKTIQDHIHFHILNLKRRE